MFPIRLQPMPTLARFPETTPSSDLLSSQHVVSRFSDAKIILTQSVDSSQLLV